MPAVPSDDRRSSAPVPPDDAPVAPRADHAPDGSSAAPAPGGEATDATPGVPMYALGRVGKAHSLDGSVTVTKPKADLLVKGRKVLVGGVEREIVRRSGSDAKPIVRFAGIESIDVAEGMRGQDILVPRDTLPELDEDEYWPDDLVGLPVTSTAGEPVGEVREVRVLPSVDVLEVARPGAPDLLVPLHREAVPELDVPGRRVVVDLVFMGEDEDAGGAPGAPAAG
ncbi:ribosome maturation factor RimM [Patulibacter americanus]|uniref:ribosome maturation factor RimM n=1 Tax=Patulibacter americanus TaxID=588672 RepID=UPI0003B67D53|nr:ribosome maturation factor RimM [Patulibacter americanus]